MNSIRRRRHAVLMAGVVIMASTTTVFGAGAAPAGAAVAANPDVAYAYGFNDFGQLGNMTERSAPSTNPVAVVDLATNVAQLATDGATSVAVHADGTVWTWGNNAFGMLGDGSGAASRHVPGKVPVLPAIAQVSVNGAHAMAVGVDGSLWAWGRNVGGQLGDGKTESQEPYAATPVRVAFEPKVAQAAAGGTFSVLLDVKGQVFTWGKNDTGQLGTGTFTDSLVPLRNTAPYGITQVAAGQSHAMAVRSVELGGAVVAWGANTAGQLGVPMTTTVSNTAVLVGGQAVAAITKIAAGDQHGLALQNDGSLWSWGSNQKGQLGDGTTVSRSAPAKVSGLSPPTQIAAGRGLSVAVAQNGSLLAWGGLPPDAAVPTVRPKQVDGPKGVGQLGVGGSNILMRMPQQPLALPLPTGDLSVVAPPEPAQVSNRPGTWAPVPGLSTTVFTAPGANLAATVSAEIFTVHTVFLRVLIDGQPSAPGDVVFRYPGAEYDGIRSFTFGREGLSAGRHIVQVEWFSSAGQPAKIRGRTLSVNSEAAGDGRVAHVVGETDFIVKSTQTWEDVPTLSRTMNLAETDNLKITFSGLTDTGTGQFFARALVDGQPTEDVAFEDPGIVGGARSYVFLRKNVSAGSHTVGIQWLAAGGKIKLADRAMTVFATPQTTARGGLVGTAFEGPPDSVTATGFVDLANASTSFTTTVPSSNVDVTAGLQLRSDHGRTRLRALIDGQPVGQNDIELSTNVNHWHARTYSFVAKNVLPGNHTVRIQIRVDAGSTALVGDRTLAVTFKRRNGTDFAQPYTLPAASGHVIGPQIGTVPTVAICFDPGRPDHAKPGFAYLQALHDGRDGGISVQGWYRENTGNQFGMAQPTYVGCSDSGWLKPPAGRTGNWYWEHGEFSLMLRDALTAADPFFNFKAFDHDNDGVLTGDELVIEIIRPQNDSYGTNFPVSTTLDGGTISASVLDLYITSFNDVSHRLVTVGILAHEGAHRILDAVDMYWDSNPVRPGYYSVMDAHFNANHFDGFHKLKGGFVTPDLVEVNGWTTRTVPLAAAETQREITIVYDPAHGDKEYFILENRWGGTGTGNFDQNLPAQGIVVWQVVQDQAFMDQFPPPGPEAVSGDWGRKGIRLIGVLSGVGQNRALTYADGTPAGIRITALEGPQEFLDTEIAKI